MMECKISDKKRNGILRICFVRNDILCKKKNIAKFDGGYDYSIQENK